MTDAYKLRTKAITTARKAPTEQQVRDTFKTPSYATRLLLPFIPKEIKTVWECAYGDGRISRIIRDAGYTVIESDIKSDDQSKIKNFLLDDPGINFDSKEIAIITNPPFSIKDLFIERCFSFGAPFALLINADYSGWQIDLINRGCEKIIPNRRIDYITPFILENIWHGTVMEILQEGNPKYKKKSDVPEDIWNRHLELIPQDYFSIDEVPNELLFKYSASQFHSMWLTYGFGIGRTETFVDLPIQSKKEDIK